MDANDRWFQVTVIDARELNALLQRRGHTVRRFANGQVVSCRKWSGDLWKVWRGEGYGIGDTFTAEQMKRFFRTRRAAGGAVVYELDSRSAELNARLQHNLSC